MKTLEKYYEQLRDWKPVQEAEAIDITGAAKWFWENPNFTGEAKEFPSPVSPYPVVWMEYQGPTGQVYKDDIRVFSQTKPWRSCAVASCIRMHDTEGNPTITRSDFAAHPALGMLSVDHAQRHIEMFDSFLETTDIGWLFLMKIGLDGFDDEFRGHIAWEPGVSGGFLTVHGEIIPEAFAWFWDSDQPQPTDSAVIDELKGISFKFTTPFLFALSLMNAKNVSLVDAPALPPKVLKRREREGKPALKFKVLQIDPMRARVKREAKPGDNEVKVALHLCRGHFKDYRESGGLFGKYKGLYWWDSQVRGTDESGRIIKDYALNAPHDAGL